MPSSSYLLCFITYFSLKNKSNAYFLLSLLLETVAFSLLQQMLLSQDICTNILANLSEDFLRLSPELWSC